MQATRRMWLPLLIPLLFLLTLPATAPAQVVVDTVGGEINITVNVYEAANVIRVDDDICLDRYLPNSTTVTKAIPIAYDNPQGKFPRLIGVYPDSIRIRWDAVATGDSIKADVKTQTRIYKNAYTAYATQDSIKVDETDKKTLATSVWRDWDWLNVAITTRAGGNATGSTRSRLWARVERWFTLPK